MAEIDYTKFKELIGGDLKTAQTKSNQLKSFGNISLFRILSDEKLEFLQNNLKIEKFQNGKKIINQGEAGEKLYIIKQGRVDFFVNSRYIRSLNDGEEFGAKSLIMPAASLIGLKILLFPLPIIPRPVLPLPWPVPFPLPWLLTSPSSG